MGCPIDISRTDRNPAPGSGPCAVGDFGAGHPHRGAHGAVGPPRSGGGSGPRSGPRRSPQAGRSSEAIGWRRGRRRGGERRRRGLFAPTGCRWSCPAPARGKAPGKRSSSPWPARAGEQRSQDAVCVNTAAASAAGHPGPGAGQRELELGAGPAPGGGLPSGAGAARGNGRGNAAHAGGCTPAGAMAARLPWGRGAGPLMKCPEERHHDVLLGSPLSTDFSDPLGRTLCSQVPSFLVCRCHYILKSSSGGENLLLCNSEIYIHSLQIENQSLYSPYQNYSDPQHESWSGDRFYHFDKHSCPRHSI